MNTKLSLATRAALLVVLALSAPAAFGQKAPKSNPLLPDVHLGLSRLGVDVSVVTPKNSITVLPVLPSGSMPEVAVRVSPVLVPATVSANVGGGGGGASVGLPPLDIGVNVNTGLPGPLLQAGLSSDAPPVPETFGQLPTGEIHDQQRAQRNLDLVPTCR